MESTIIIQITNLLLLDYTEYKTILKTMKNLIYKITAVFMLLLFSMSVFSQSEAEMEEDAEKLHSLYKRIDKIGDPRVSANIWSYAGENYKTYQNALDQIDNLRLVKANSQGFLKSLAKKYAPKASVQAQVSGMVARKFAPLDLGYDTRFEFRQIEHRFKIVETAGEQNASNIVKRVKEYIEENEELVKVDDRFRMKSLDEYKNLLAIAPLFVPEEHRLVKRVARLEPQLAELAKRYESLEKKLIAQNKWKKGISKVSTGRATSVATAAKKYLTTRGTWGGKDPAKQTKILRVEILRDWFVADSIIGIPLRYGITGVVAVKDNTMSPGVITVYEVSFITKGAKKTTDFNQLWTRDISRMLEKNLPK